MGDRRGGDAKMHFLRAGLSHHLHDFYRGRPTNDGIIDEHDPLAADNRAVVSGKRIVLIDDSIVRGTTSVKIVQMMREAGAKEVHFRIASPPITHSDYYGIDTPERDKLLAATHDLEGMRRFIGADSLAFL